MFAKLFCQLRLCFAADGMDFLYLDPSIQCPYSPPFNDSKVENWLWEKWVLVWVVFFFFFIFKCFLDCNIQPGLHHQQRWIFIWITAEKLIQIHVVYDHLKFKLSLFCQKAQTLRIEFWKMLPSVWLWIAWKISTVWEL